MELRQLQALVAVADYGSFSAAAVALGTVQSNVSTHVARLERELGVQLVDRQMAALTEEGTTVVERARRIASEIDAVVADIASQRAEMIGTVRLGMIGTTARWLAPLLLDQLARDHPGIRLVIGDGTSTNLEPQVAGGALDAAVVNLPHGSPDLAERPLFDEDLILVVAKGHPLAERRGDLRLEDLAGLALLLPAPGSPFRRELDDAAQAVGVTLTPQAELDGLRLIASLTRRGVGPAILPASGASDAGDGSARLTVGGLPRRRVGVVTRRRGRPSAPARAVMAIIDEVVPLHFDRDHGLHPPTGRP